MAIYSSVPPPHQGPPEGVDIDTWAAQAIANHMSLVDPHNVAASVEPQTLFIPLYEPTPAPKPKKVLHTAQSLLEKEKARMLKEKSKRADAKERGKEGSRRRKRYENDLLIGVPGVQPPRPEDWEVHRVGPKWKAQYSIIDGVELSSGVALGDGRNKGKKGTNRPEVPSELRKRCHKQKAVRDMLRGLEEEVRGFVAEWAAGEARTHVEEETTSSDSSDEEIVFVGHDLSARTKREKEERHENDEMSAVAKRETSRLIDAAAPFSRYLVHVLATYYGLRSWSVDGENDRERLAVLSIKAPLDACQVPKRLLSDIV